jgi:hypothetical protein
MRVRFHPSIPAGKKRTSESGEKWYLYREEKDVLNERKKSL